MSSCDVRQCAYFIGLAIQLCMIMKREAFPAHIRMNQSEFLSIIILDARFSNAPTWPLVIYDSI